MSLLCIKKRSYSFNEPETIISDEGLCELLVGGDPEFYPDEEVMDTLYSNVIFLNHDVSSLKTPFSIFYYS